MRRVALVTGNPANPEDRLEMRSTVQEVLDQFPDAKLTWLQSAATNQQVKTGIMFAHHLLTCAIEYEIDEPVLQKKAMQPAARKARR